MKKVILSLFVIIILALGFYSLKVLKVKYSALKNKEFPSFSLPNSLDPSKIITEKDLKGEISLVNIFASWCVVCRAEHDMFVDLLKNENVKIYGINWKDDKEDLDEWLKELGNPYNLIIDDKKGDLVIKLGVTGIPETFIVNKDGKIIYHLEGALTEDIISEEIIPILAQEKAKK